MKLVWAGIPAVVAGTALLFSATAAAQNFETQSGKVLCAVTPDRTLIMVGPSGMLSAPPAKPYDVVVCQGDLRQTGFGYSVVTTGDGSAYGGVNGNIAVHNPTTKMSYGQTYYSGNWTIYHDENGTRFTNNRTGHGMFVSIQKVYVF